MGSDPRPPRRRPRCPRATWLVDVGALDQEGDPDVGAVLVEVLAPDARADDVDCTDVPQRGLRLLQRLHRRVVAGRLRAANQLDDLDYGHSLLLFVAFRVPGPDLGAGSTPTPTPASPECVRTSRGVRAPAPYGRRSLRAGPPAARGSARRPLRAAPGRSRQGTAR